MFNILTQVGTDALEVNLLVGMKNLLETNGWCQKTLRDYEDKVCLLGAARVYTATFDMVVYTEVHPTTGATCTSISPSAAWCMNEDLLDRILRPYISGKGIVDFNDEESRTYEDIINLLDKAIADRGGFV